MLHSIKDVAAATMSFFLHGPMNKARLIQRYLKETLIP
jgi:hypothetical protein